MKIDLFMWSIITLFVLVPTTGFINTIYIKSDLILNLIVVLGFTAILGMTVMMIKSHKKLEEQKQ